MIADDVTTRPRPISAHSSQHERDVTGRVETTAARPTRRRGADSVETCRWIDEAGQDRPALIRVAAGLGASIALTRVMRSLLFDVEPTDPLVLAGVSVLLLLIAAVASLAPARRAARLDPIEVVRTE